MIPVTCTNDQIQCKNGVCTDSSNRCLYETDKYGWTKGCRDMTHLQNCGKYGQILSQTNVIGQHYVIHKLLIESRLDI